ncbi:MAG: hypothetical protein U9N52_10400 [Campylobacterota bacterium]|nr:hypothetical protein [Campylobacterota bacterium]
MKYRSYRIAIAYFSLFSIALVMSGLAMFILKTGFSFNGVSEYYLGKSVEGLLELSHPHFGAMGLFIMVLGHFFVFTALRNRVSKGFLALFVLALLALGTPFLILKGFAWMSIVKIFSVTSFVLLSVYFSIKLLGHSR